MFFSTSPEQKLKKIVTWVRGFKINLPQNPDDIKTITRLDLSGKAITKIPSEIECLESLAEINLSYNGIKELPKELGKLKNLRSLNLGYNMFQDVPEVIFSFSQLEVLNLEANHVKKIPKEIEKLRNLANLNLFANQIPEIPEEFCSLDHLMRLNLALNQISKLPLGFEKLDKLVELDLWLNKFDLIPDVVGKLPNLRDMYESFDTDKLNKALVMAVFADNLHLADKLVFYGADVNFELEGFRSQLFTTPLFEAKSPEMVKKLIEKGADPNLKREIIKHVLNKNGEEEIRNSGKHETFLTTRHTPQIDKLLKTLNLKTNAEE